MLKNMTIKGKLALVVLAGLFTLATVLTVISVTMSSTALENAEMSKLEAVETSKKGEIEEYLNYIEGLLTSLSGQEGTKEAFVGFEKGFYSMQDELNLDVAMVESRLKGDFENNFLSGVNYKVPNSEQRKSTSSYIPSSDTAKVAQYVFITDNSSALGSKNGMTYNAKYSASSYMETHKKYHESFDKFLNAYGLYDIFMVDLKGNIIYTDFKEKDFATNLKSGVYSNTGIAKAYNKALSKGEGQIAFDDFRPYEPSYNAAAAFLATPIFIDGVKKGVMIFQMPVDQINKIMQFNGHYEEAGMGESGEVYLVGSDYKMRSNSRFQKDIANSVVKSLGTTIGVFTVKSDSTKAALDGKHGSWIIKDYRGVDVLSAYSEINVYGETKWAVVAEIDEEEALEPAHHLRNMIIIASLIIFVLLNLVSIAFVRSNVIKPLSKFQDGILNFFKYLNKETSSTTALDDSSHDEIGTMAKVVNENITKTKKLIEEDQRVIDAVKNAVAIAKTGLMKQKIEESTSNEGLEELKIGFNDLLETVSSKVSGDLNKISSALDFYSQLDFTHRIDGDLGEVSKGLNNLADIINDMLVDNKQTGLTLDVSSKTLLTNVDTLNNNSNSAAASLEQTAAALEEVTSNISNNTQNVVKMAGFATSLTASSNEGQKLATQTTEAMNDVDQQVNSINDAISVIDQISFQTNILSLNAAVEAATAGESGKGFAVVAQEVRNLASRSSDAANEIKTLVQNATDKANYGKSIADKMIEGYVGLNENITKTINLIADIESASKEQKIGIEQINDAVNNLDQQTQQNASIASATYEIAVQTDKLAKVVVDNADEKEFIGKDKVKAKVMDRSPSTNNVVTTTSVTPKVSVAKPAKKTPVKQVVSKPLVSSTNDSEHWESF